MRQDERSVQGKKVKEAKERDAQRKIKETRAREARKEREKEREAVDATLTAIFDTDNEDKYVDLMSSIPN